MSTYEDIRKANETLQTIDVKGKGYVQVNERVKAFRMIHPDGAICTEIIKMEGDLVTMKATVTDADGRILATGMAQEDRKSSYINKTSYIENCETSAVGRALGFVGIGIDASMCSADELANAINQQNAIKRRELDEAQAEAPAYNPEERFQMVYRSLGLTDMSGKENVKKMGEMLTALKTKGMIANKKLDDMTEDEHRAAMTALLREYGNG